MITGGEALVKGFRDFLLKQNLVATAVAFVIATAFTALVTAFVRSFITPLIGVAAGGHGDFSNNGFTVKHTLFPWGAFVTALITFIVVAAVVYFLVLVPFTTLMRRFRMLDEPTPTKECPECLSSIPEGARRCAFCTAAQPAAA